MDTIQPLIPPTHEELLAMKKDLQEDTERLENHVKLFKDWLNFQPHLPKYIEGNLITNFIRWCKYDLQKAKKKFELYVVYKQKLTKFFKDRTILEEEFQLYDSSRTAMLLPKLTKEGYRIFIVRFDSNDANRFDFLSSLKFALWCSDYVMFNDTHVGVSVIYDMNHFTVSTVAKLDLSLMSDFINLLVNVLPARIKQFHFVNANPLAKPVIMLFKSVLSEKINKRMIFHDKFENLYEYIPRELLPKEYGGSYSSVKEISSKWERFLLEGDWFKEKVHRLRLCGPIPDEKKALFNLEDYGTEGSFRKLQID